MTGTNAWGNGSKDPIGTQLDAAAWLRDSGVVPDPTDANALVQTLLEYLFPEPPDAKRLDYFLNIVFLDQLPSADWSYEWEQYAKTGDDTEVKIPLGRLLNAALYAPEYQVL